MLWHMHIATFLMIQSYGVGFTTSDFKKLDPCNDTVIAVISSSNNIEKFFNITDLSSQLQATLYY